MIKNKNENKEVLKKIITYIDKEISRIQDKRNRVIRKYKTIDKIPEKELEHLNVGMISFLQQIRFELREGLRTNA